MPSEAQLASIKAAEEEIQAVLHDLAVSIGGEVESVKIDTYGRPGEDARVQIFTSVDNED